jgi:hypothetical protein
MVIETVLLLEGIMDVQSIEEITRAEMAGLSCNSREPGWILYHGKRTGNLAVLLARKLNC